MPTMLTKRPKFPELDRLYASLEKASKEILGYPENHFFDYSKLYRFLQFSLNNIGDPFNEGGFYRIHTHAFEREVIDMFAELFHAPEGDYWGYVTNGGTEGNLYGLYLARELYPEGVVIYSEETHYSIAKNCRLLRMPAISVKTQLSGEIDYRELQHILLNEKRTPILVANIGTTMKGAVDDVIHMRDLLRDLKYKKYYIHCDAAFFGMILPFVPEVDMQAFDFRTGIDSIAVSGHKMIGTPIPCGVVLVKKSYAEKVSQSIEYIGDKDKTITGSRNGFTPLLLWYELKSAKKRQMEKIIHLCFQRASYTIKKFNEAGINAWRNKNSLIVVFPRISDKLARKWQCAVAGKFTHIITLPQVTERKIDAMIREVASELKSTRSRSKRMAA